MIDEKNSKTKSHELNITFLKIWGVVFWGARGLRPWVAWQMLIMLMLLSAPTGSDLLSRGSAICCKHMLEGEMLIMCW